MTKSQKREAVPNVIERLFDAGQLVTSGTVATAAGISRQGAAYHLRALAERGDLIHLGAGRGGHYERVANRVTTYPLVGLREDDVWTLEFSALRVLDLTIFDNPKMQPILLYTFTEMLNNAIDHSGGEIAIVRWFYDARRIAFEIEDDGVGAFLRMKETRGLADEFDAVGEISKGKQTTDPKRHSGLGIYYSSRLASRFVLSSGNLRWIVDNEIGDNAIGWLDQPRRGTLVRIEVAHDTTVERTKVFESLSVPGSYAYNKTTVRVGLFGSGAFVSRSEAKRIGAHLEDFAFVELDFSGVNEVGQGFIDELFRVWRTAHPETTLVAINANPAVMSMIARTAPSSDSQ